MEAERVCLSFDGEQGKKCIKDIRPPGMVSQKGHRQAPLKRKPPDDKGADVIRIGFEPMTYCLEGSCSIQLSYRTFRRLQKYMFQCEFPKKILTILHHWARFSAPL